MSISNSARLAAVNGEPTQHFEVCDAADTQAQLFALRRRFNECKRVLNWELPKHSTRHDTNALIAFYQTELIRTKQAITALTRVHRAIA